MIGLSLKDLGFVFFDCIRKLMRLNFLNAWRLVVGESLKVRHVVPILGVPDALVPLEVPVSQLTLFPGYWDTSQFIQSGV